MFQSRAKRRAELRQRPMEAERVAIIERRFPYFGRLSDADKRELLGHVQVFLAEKNFEGCGGLELTDEIKLTIAAQACLLLLHRETDYYPLLDVILVYPHAYVAGHSAREGAVIVDRDDVRLGESHQRGIVVLSWDAVRGGAEDPDDGQNVVFHEFAHQLDQEDGAADGAPILPRRSSYAPWAKILGAELAALREDAESDAETVIDKYGAKNPAEFFAVVTEAFFEKPRALATSHPALYDELAAFYVQDPLERLGEPRPDPHPRVQALVEAKPAERADVVTSCDMSNDPRAAELVFVGEPLRSAVQALGFTHCGYLGTLHKGTGAWGYVSDVLRCPDDFVVGALSSIGDYGDGLALWTILENGTIISTETNAHRSLGMRLTRVWAHHPREHFFIVSLGGTPGALYEAHRRRVNHIASRERTVPLRRDPFSTYVAAKLRSGDLFAIGDRTVIRIFKAVFWSLFALAAIATVAVLFTVAPARAIGLRLGLVLFVVLVASFITATLLVYPLTWVVHIHKFRSAPSPPASLFERAARVDDSAADRIAALVPPRTP
jgi:Mlc titration factor MtfA (ptsG expression regulator)